MRTGDPWRRLFLRRWIFALQHPLLWERSSGFVSSSGLLLDWQSVSEGINVSSLGWSRQEGMCVCVYVCVRGSEFHSFERVLLQRSHLFVPRSLNLNINGQRGFAPFGTRPPLGHAPFGTRLILDTPPSGRGRGCAAERPCF